MRPARTVCLGLLFVALAASLDTGPSSAEMPRKGRRSVPSHTARAAPDITATIAKQVAPRPPATSVARDAEIPTPITLPIASRARYRACGETWRDMKLAGTTGDDDWREFAFKCLVGQGPTSSTH